MRQIFQRLHVQAVIRVKPVLACLAALAVLGAAGPIIAAALTHATPGHAASVHESARWPVTQRPAVMEHPARRQGTSQRAAAAYSGPRCSAGYLLTRVHLKGVRVDSAAMNTSGAFAAPSDQPLTGLPAFCDVTITQPDQAGNPLHTDLWLPSSWNGRFQGVGGSVYACGPWFYELAPAIRAGYAAAATDCGVPPADLRTAGWALKNGQLDWPLIHDFAYAGIHDMTVTGKAVTRLFYRSPPRYSYFNGCSTGGREGLEEAQRYPADYNGIVSGAPAINWTQFIPAEIWPQLVMNLARDFLPDCKEAAFTNAAVRACATSGGVITNPSACHWDPARLVGVMTPCGVITVRDAAVMRKIWRGPEDSDGKPLWYGLERGTSLAGIAATYSSDGMTTGQPFPIAVSWLGTFLQHDPSWDWHTLTFARFDQLFRRSVSRFSKVFAANNPDLSVFKKDGGKIIIWHGLSDQLIFPQGTVRYYRQVEQAMGGPRPAGSFARLFLAPGAQHCASGAGPAPASPAQPLDSLVSWVEKGKAPTSIPGAAVDPATGLLTPSRPLCRYPRVAECGS